MIKIERLSHLKEGDFVDVFGMLLQQSLYGSDPVHQALGIVQTVNAQDHLLRVGEVFRRRRCQRLEAVVRNTCDGREGSQQNASGLCAIRSKRGYR